MEYTFLTFWSLLFNNSTDLTFGLWQADILMSILTVADSRSPNYPLPGKEYTDYIIHFMPFVNIHTITKRTMYLSNVFLHFFTKSAPSTALYRNKTSFTVLFSILTHFQCIHTF